MAYDWTRGDRDRRDDFNRGDRHHQSGYGSGREQGYPDRDHSRTRGENDYAGGWSGRAGRDEDERGGFLYDEQRMSGRSHGEGSWTGSSMVGGHREHDHGGGRGYGQSGSYGAFGGQRGDDRSGFRGRDGDHGDPFRSQGGSAPQQGRYGGLRDEVFGARPDRFFGGGGSHGTGSPRDDRGLFDKAADEVSSWFGDDDAQRRRERDQHRGRGPKGYSRSDERIREDINDRLTEDWALDASDIEVGVSNREVTLSGEVTGREDKRRAEDIAESVSGVGHVQNNLRVKGRTGASQSGSSTTVVTEGGSMAGGAGSVSTGEQASAHAGTALSSLSQTESSGKRG